jgi:Fe-S cluster assembly ATP-binding protein
VSLANFLRVAVNARNKALNPEDKGISVVKFRQLLKSKMDLLKMDYQFAGRYLNEGFSGGEKKRAEILQMAMLEPRFAILDETDSGLDIDALRIVSEGVNTLAQGHIGVLVITHYQRMLNYINPDFVHIMYGGRIVESGKAGLALRLEEQGYDWIREKYGVFSDSAQE